MCPFFSSKKNLAIHTEWLKAQNNNEWGVLGSPFTRLVLVAFGSKKCQTIYTIEKRIKNVV